MDARTNRLERIMVGVATGERFGASQYDRESMQVHQSKAYGDDLAYVRGQWVRNSKDRRNAILAALKSVKAYKAARPEIQAAVYRRIAHSPRTKFNKTRDAILALDQPRGVNLFKRSCSWSPAYDGMSRIENEQYRALLQEVGAVAA